MHRSLALSALLAHALGCSQVHGRPPETDAGRRVDDATVALADGGPNRPDSGRDGGPPPTFCTLSTGGVTVGEGCFCHGPILSRGDVLYRQSIGIEVYDVRNPRIPELVRVVEERAGSVGGLAISRGGFLISATNFAALHIYSLTDPLDPQPVGMLELAGYAENVVAVGDLAVVLIRDEHFTFRVDLVDVSDPTDPALVGSIALGDRYLTAMAVFSDRVLGVAIPSAETGPPVLVELDLGARTARLHTLFEGDLEIAPAALAVDGDLVYIAASDGTLRAYARAGDTWVVRGEVEGLGWPFALEVRAGRAIVSSDGGVSVIDVREPPVFRVLGRSAEVGAGGFVASREDVVYLSSGGNVSVVELACE